MYLIYSHMFTRHLLIDTATARWNRTDTDMLRNLDHLERIKEGQTP
jgi:hypothetical protein